MIRLFKQSMYAAAMLAIVVGVVQVALAWAPIETSLDLIYEYHFQWFMLPTGVLMLAGAWVNPWHQVSLVGGFTRALMTLVSPFVILIGLGAEGDAEPIYKFNSLVALVFLSFAAAEFIRYAKR